MKDQLIDEADQTEVLATDKPSMLDCEFGFAVPGSDSIIDCVNQVTGRSWIYGHTLEEIRLRYPGAELVNIDEHCSVKAKRQDTEVEWIEATEDRYHEMLNVLPPAAWTNGAFLVGEAYDHHAKSGRPRFQTFRRIGCRHYASSRPMTHAEFCAEFGPCSNDYAE